MRSLSYWIEELSKYLGEGPVECMVIESGIAEAQFFKKD